MHVNILIFNIGFLFRNSYTISQIFSGTRPLWPLCTSRHWSSLITIGINGYNFIHSDRDSQAGDVGLYIKNSITYKIINELYLNLNFAENICIEVETNKKSIVVGVVYRHPGYIVNQIELFTKAIEKNFLNE